MYVNIKNITKYDSNKTDFIIEHFEMQLAAEEIKLREKTDPDNKLSYVKIWRFSSNIF